ncbi:hypothetical protein [Azonexus hydrophilus]|uniref:Uncharacterized protein n=1 Tax=Azonexus hydrophilus TaxID=418702 RepID=A0ABZ2XDE9_9RHOO
MVPLILRATLRKVLPRAWRGANNVKDGVDLFTTVRDWISEAGPVKKAVAATIGAAVIAAPFAAPTLIERASAQALNQPQYLSANNLTVAEDDGRVFHASYLVANRHVLERIKYLCESGVESNMARCEQAMYAYSSIANEARKESIRRSFTTKW